MAIERVAKGTAKDKTGANTLTISSVQVARRLLVVGIAYDSGSGDPEVKWGSRVLKLVESVSGNGITTSIYAYKRRRAAATKDIVATWTSGPTAKVMFASTFSDVGMADIVSSNSQASTGSPNSGVAATTNIADEVFIGVMGSEGPSSDASGTPSNGYSAGQRDGTVGAPPVSNITIQEIYKIVTATESTQAEITGAGSRNWSSALVTFARETPERFAFTEYDFEEMLDLEETGDLSRTDLFFKRNLLLGRNEIWHIDSSGTRTLKKTWKPDTATGWVTV